LNIIQICNSYCGKLFLCSYARLRFYIRTQNTFYFIIILIELMYIVFVPFDWTRALLSVCFRFAHHSMNFFAFLIPLLLDEPFLYNQHKQYGDRRREATIVSD